MARAAISNREREFDRPFRRERRASTQIVRELIGGDGGA